MGTFQVADTRIIRPSWVGMMNDAGEHTAGVQQVRYRAKRCRPGGFRLCGGIQVSPGCWDERAGPVGQNQDEVQLAMASHPAKQRQHLTFQWVPPSEDRDFNRVALEVSSV
jgi:hypothetical protein